MKITPRSKHSQEDSAASFRLADSLHSAAIHLLRRLRTEDNSSGLTAPRLSALSVIVLAGPVTVTDLAAAEQVRPPTISRLVKDLEADGLVKRRVDKGDRRVRLIEATSSGRKLLTDGRERRVAALARDVSRLGPEQRRTLARAATLLEELSKPAPSGPA